MDYDENDSQGHNLAGEGNSKSSPVLRPFALPKFDFDESHLRFEGLVENEVFLGISSQEDSQWIEDYSRGNSAIEFSSSATEPCSISRHNNVWSEATSSESVAMLLKSVGQEERIQGETLIQESNTCNELGRLTTEMEPNLKQDDRSEDVPNSQPTANTDSFLDERNVNALESKNNSLPVGGSSGVVSIVSSLIMSEADVGSDDKCDDTKLLEVNNIEHPQIDNLGGLTPEIHVQNVISGELNGQENEHRVSNAGLETVDGLLIDIPQQIITEQNICRTESTVVNTMSSGNGSRVGSSSESIEQEKAETNLTSINEPPKFQENLTCDLQIEEVCKIDQGSAVPSPPGNVEVGACNKSETICKPFQDSPCDSSVACLDDKDVGNSASTGLEISIVGDSDISLSCTVSGSQCENQLSTEDVSDIKTSIVLEDNNSPEAQTSSLVVGEHVQISKSNLSSEQDVHSFGKDVSSHERKDVKSDTASLCPDESSKANLVYGSEIPKSASNGPGSRVTEEMNLLSCDTPTDPPLLSGSKSHKTTADGVTIGEQEQRSQVANVSGINNSPQVPTNLEPFSFPESGQGSRVTEEMNLLSCDTLTDPPVLSGSNTTVDGVTIGEQEQKSQVANVLGINNSPQVPTNLEPFGIPESGQACRIDQEAGPGCSTKVEPCPALKSSDLKLADNTAPAARKSNEEILMERNAEVALNEVSDEVLLSSQHVVPPESLSVSMVESCIMIQKDHEVLVTSGTQLAENPSTKVDSPEKTQASASLACPSKCIADSVKNDGDASANSFEENVHPPFIISCANTPLSENEQPTRTIEVSVGSAQHSDATPGADGMVQPVSLHMQHDNSNNGGSSTLELNLSIDSSKGETIKGLQSYPVQVHKESTKDVKEFPSEGNPGPPSVVSCAKIPPSETGKKSRAKDASVSTVQHFEGTPAGGEKVQSAALHMQHSNSNEGQKITIELSSSTGLSESEIIKGLPSFPSIPDNKLSTDVEGYPLAADCSQIDLTMVSEHSHEKSEGPGPMSGKKVAGTKGTSERKTRQGSVKTSARANAKKRGVPKTPVKQFEGDKLMMISSSPGTSNAELSGIKACGALPTPMSNIPDLNTSVSPAYLQQPFTDPQQMQLRAQILVHGSLMQNSVPDEACMITAFGPSDGGGGGGCLWEPTWRACNERIYTQKSIPSSNLETPVRSLSGSKGPDQPVKKSSRQSKSSLRAGRASSKGIPAPVVNPIIPPLSPLWNVSTPSSDGLQSSGTFDEYHQPFAPLQPYQAQGTGDFVEQSPSWLSQTHFPGQWVATTQTSALDANAHVSSMFGTEPVKLTPAKVSSVTSHLAINQTTQCSVSTGGGAGVFSGTSSQTDGSILPCQNSVNPKHKKRKKVSVSKSPGQIPSLTLDQAASVSDTTNHPSEKSTAPQAIFQNSLLPQSLPEMRSPNVSSTPNAAKATFLASTGHSSNYLAAVSPSILSDQPTRVNQIVDKNSINSEETLDAVKAAWLQAEGAAAHADAAVGNCNDVWSQLSKLKNSGLRFDDETKLSSAAMAIAAAASVAKAAAAAAKLASNIAIGAKLMADEVATKSVTINNTHSTETSLSRSLNNSSLAGEGNVSARSIIAAAKETVKKRVEAATAASKHAENLDAIVKAAELAAEAVSQAGKIVSIGDPLPLSELVGSGPTDYWRTPQVSPEQGLKACIDQRDTFNSEKLVPDEPPKDGAVITGEAVNPGTVASIVKNSSTTQRGRPASGPALDSFSGTNSETVPSRDAHRTAPGTSFENGMVEGCVVEVFKEGGKFKAAWYSAKILNLNNGKAFVCYTELQADDGSGKLKEWVPLKGDDLKAPTIRIPHPSTSMCFDRTRKRRRAAVMDYTWCVGDRVDVWIQDCWLEGVVKEKNKNDETTLTISIPALGGTSAVKTWHLRPTVTWQDGKWIEWPYAIQLSPTQGDKPQEKRVKLGHPTVEVDKEDKISKGSELVELKDHEKSRQLPLLANEKEFNIGNNTGDIKLDASRIARTGLQKEGSRVVFGVPKPGKKRKFMDVSKHLGSDKCSKNTKTTDSVKSARYLPQGRGGRSLNNTKVDINEKQAAEDKSKVFRSGKLQSVSSKVLPPKTNPLVAAKSMGKTVSKEEDNSAQRDLMEFGSVSDTPSEGPVSSKGLPRVPHKRVPSSNTKSVQLNKGKCAAAGEFDKKAEQDKSFPHVAEPRRSSRKIQPTSRLLEGLQSSLIGSKIPSVPHEKTQRNLNRGDDSNHS